MDRTTLTRRLTGPVAAILLSAVLLAAVFMLSAAAQHAPVMSHYYTTLLAVNVVGIIVLLVLIAFNVFKLFRQLRAQVLGSRLTLRLLGIYVLLVIIPLSVVYYISVRFLHKGIDSWYDVRIEQALDDALLLGRTSLEAIKEQRTRKVEEIASQLDSLVTDTAMIRALDDLREQAGFTEMTLFSQDGRIIASSALDASTLIPDWPGELALSKLRRGEVYANIEPVGDESLELRIVVPVYPLDVKQPVRVLQVIEPLPLRYAKLGESVQSAFTEYEQLVYLRGPLKLSFVLTLTLVTLIALLLMVWAAIFSTRRLTAPLRDLAEGTRAVARGDYGKQLPVSSGDEMGVLVQSFNEMTHRIHLAQSAAKRSQREAEAQRTYLETVLAHLSSGVLSVDRRGLLLAHNATAGQILGIDIGRDDGRALEDIAAEHPRLEPFFNTIRAELDAGAREWQQEVSVYGPRGRKTLMCRGTRLPGARGRAAGCVVVFDDVTTLIQAQRDAAWGEVARRLAHEIKNPLTPIQLSAERIRHKYLNKLDPAEREALDRATRTIAEQVESMKAMVNAFSSYAQPSQMQRSSVSLNQLVQDVVELHKGVAGAVRIELTLADDMSMIRADPGRLRQVLNNLLINARDALHKTGQPRIEITTRAVQEGENRYAQLEIADNGPGFPEDLLDRVFEPYVTTKDKGNGLGLAIVKKIIEEHGGTIWAENRAGDGAVVTLRLPAERAAGAGDEAPVAAAGSALREGID